MFLLPVFFDAELLKQDSLHLKRDAAWIGSVVSDMDKKAPGKIVPSILVQGAGSKVQVAGCKLQGTEYSAEGRNSVYFSEGQD